jgi:hypothetical protein
MMQPQNPEPKKGAKITITSTRITPSAARKREEDMTSDSTDPTNQTLEEEKRTENLEFDAKPEREEIDIEKGDTIENFANILWGFSDTNAGIGMLAFRRQRTFVWLAEESSRGGVGIGICRGCGVVVIRLTISRVLLGSTSHILFT